MIAYCGTLNDIFPASNHTVSLAFVPDPPGGVVSNFDRVCEDCASWCLEFATLFDHIDTLCRLLSTDGRWNVKRLNESEWL